MKTVQIQLVIEKSNHRKELHDLLQSKKARKLLKFVILADIKSKNCVLDSIQSNLVELWCLSVLSAMALISSSVKKKRKHRRVHLKPENRTRVLPDQYTVKGLNGGGRRGRRGWGEQ